jgi:hypothetical protein
VKLELEQGALCHWPDRKFKALPEVNDWIRAFSEGRGEEGKALYAKCSANCSPRYEFEISNEGEQMRLPRTRERGDEIRWGIHPRTHLQNIMHRSGKPTKITV